MWRHDDSSAMSWRHWLPSTLFARQATYVLRLGQAFIQLWQEQGNGRKNWVQVASAPAHHIAHGQHQALPALLSLLVENLPAGTVVQVVADSKWMPVSLLLTGMHPLSDTQVQALAQHRFTDIYGQEARSWRVQTNYVSGDTCALAFACPTGLQESVQRGLSLSIGLTEVAPKLTLSGLQPTLPWLWHQARRNFSKADSWFVVAEHDRTLMAWIAKGKVQALLPAGPQIQSPTHVKEAIKPLAWRCGLVVDKAPAVVLSFEAPHPAQQAKVIEGVRWHALQAVEAAP